MSNEIKKEKWSWVIAELIFLGLYIFISGWYTSYPLMEWWLKALVWVGRVGAVTCIVISWVKFNDPNYEKYRKVTIGLCIALSLIIGIHHAVNREDNQVIIDSRASIGLSEEDKLVLVWDHDCHYVYMDTINNKSWQKELNILVCEEMKNMP